MYHLFRWVFGWKSYSKILNTHYYSRSTLYIFGIFLNLSYKWRSSFRFIVLLESIRVVIGLQFLLTSPSYYYSQDSYTGKKSNVFIKNQILGISTCFRYSIFCRLPFLLNMESCSKRNGVSKEIRGNVVISIERGLFISWKW